MLPSPQDRVARLRKVDAFHGAERAFGTGQGGRESFADQGGVLVLGPLRELERPLVVLPLHRVLRIAEHTPEVGRVDAEFLRELEPPAAREDLLRRGIEDRELVRLRSCLRGELQRALVVQALERFLRVDEELHDFRHVDVPFLRFRDERGGARDRVVGLAVQRGRLVRSLVRFVEESQALVIVLHAEREARAAQEVRHLVDVDLEPARGSDAGLEQPRQLVRGCRERIHRTSAGRDDLRGAASDEEAIQLPVQRLERGDARPEVHAHPDRGRKISDDLVRPVPRPFVDESLAFPDGREGAFEVPGSGGRLRAVQERLQLRALIAEVRERRPQDGDLARDAVRQELLRLRLDIRGELEGLPVLVRLRRDDRVLQELRWLREIGPVLLAEGQHELRALDRLHDALALGPAQFVERPVDGLLDLDRVALLVRLARDRRELPRPLRRDAESLRLRERAMEFLEAAFDLAIPFRNAFRLIASRALFRSVTGPRRSTPMLVAATNFSRDVAITPTTRWNCACWRATNPCFASCAPSR